MSRAAIDIDRLVREVLTDMGTQSADQTSTQTASAGIRAPRAASPLLPSALPHPEGTRPAEALDDVLATTSRVVTIELLKSRLDGVRRLCVPRGAVLTPAVRDELRRRNIALEYADQSNTAKIAARLQIVVAAANYDPAHLIYALKRDNLPVECGVEKCLIAATDGLAREIAGGDALGLLLTEHAAAALCLLNRLPGVRAVGTDLAAAASISANAMVVDPRRTSIFQLKRMAAEFLRGGVRECPAVFRERLS
jgi:hypothetical protein